MRYRIPQLKYPIMTSSDEMRQARMRRKSPQFVGVSQNDRLETLFARATQNTVFGCSNEDLVFPSL